MRKRPRIALAALGVVLASSAVGTAAPPTRAEGAGTATVPPINVLDGARFSGKLIPQGESSGPADEFVFSGGKFHSRACLEWGFAPGPYWVRSADGRLHFLAELKSAENGVMTYIGTIDGPAIDARVEWVKPRWYWTMEQTFRFRGTSKTPDARAN